MCGIGGILVELKLIERGTGAKSLAHKLVCIGVSPTPSSKAVPLLVVLTSTLILDSKLE